nr:gamma-tubulin complex component 5-like isoform X1 [Ipomoea batatas]
MEASTSLIEKIYSSFSGGLHFVQPISSLRTNEVDLVRGVLQILQGLSSSLFYWDDTGERFCAKKGIYVSHLSQTSLYLILDQFTYAATCLKLVEIIVNKVEKSVRAPPPTLRAFLCSISTWLRRLRDVALQEESKISNTNSGTSPTLLGLSNSLSNLCAGAEYLLQIVHGAIPKVYIEQDSSITAADIAVHILNHLYNKLTEVCLVQGGEEDAYRMTLHVFAGSLLPYIEGLDSWLFEGILDDPFEEMFFYANKAVTVHEAEFWEKSYLLRSKNFEKFDVLCDSLISTRERKDISLRESVSLSGLAKGKETRGTDCLACPLFMKGISRTIVSAGKSLQLIRHAPLSSLVSVSGQGSGQCTTGLTLSEIFCVSLAALIGQGDHISEYFKQENQIRPSFESFNQEIEKNKALDVEMCFNKEWYKLLSHTIAQNRKADSQSAGNYNADSLDLKEDKVTLLGIDGLQRTFVPGNPAMTVSQSCLLGNRDYWDTLNLSKSFFLPPLNDEGLRTAMFSGNAKLWLTPKNTNYAFGSQFGESECIRLEEDAKFLEELFPFPTLLPPFQEDLQLSEVLPFQKNSTLPSRTLSWIGNVEPKCTPLPVVILQECLINSVKKQANCIGRNILSKLLCDWRLLDELGVLRAIYLLGSGDLLQHFLTVIFNKLDKGESLDDEFDLNMILQESIRNSADAILLNTPDSLVVSISRNTTTTEDEQNNLAVPTSTPRISRGQNFGIDGLDSLTFTYKVSWPLELIANLEAIKKYNRVMRFLLKIRRAKFVLDKARRWMLKDRSTATANCKRHWLLEQKLLHFVDAFHQYVMDRVYHSAWRELCEGMAAAASLDEVIEVHEAYLSSIQRQCFVVPDKLWALIASRINSILGLALDFYSIQQTLNSGGTVSAVKARCEMEVDRIDRQFDDCIAFLLRILSFKLNVGQFPHLADLVTRINYNYYYMSDNGTLVTASPSDSAASKSGKAFQVKKE